MFYAFSLSLSFFLRFNDQSLFRHMIFALSLFLLCSLHLYLPVNLLTYYCLAHSLLPFIHHSPSLYTSLYTSINLSIYFSLSIYLSHYISISLSISLSIYLYIDRSIYLSIFQYLTHSSSFPLSPSLSLSPSINLFIPCYQSPSTSFSH